MAPAAGCPRAGRGNAQSGHGVRAKAKPPCPNGDGGLLSSSLILSFRQRADQAQSLAEPSPRLPAHGVTSGGGGAGKPKGHASKTVLFRHRTDQHDHLTTLHFRKVLDAASLFGVFGNTLQQVATQFLVGHFAATEPQGDFHLVAVFEKLEHVRILTS